MATHRYWRIYITANNGSTYSAIGELQFREKKGEAQVPSGGVASASTEYDSNHSAAKGFDDNTDTTWATSNNNQAPSWLAYDFGAGNEIDVEEVAITSRAGTSTGEKQMAPKDFAIEYSDDGSSWDELLSRSGETTWDPKETRVFSDLPELPTPLRATLAGAMVVAVGAPPQTTDPLRTTLAGSMVVALSVVPPPPRLEAIPMPGAILAQVSEFRPSILHPDEDHVATRYEVTSPADPSFAAPLFTYEYEHPDEGLRIAILDGLDGLEDYLVRAGHEGAISGWGAWSNVVAVTTLDLVDRPDKPTAILVSYGHDFVSATSTAFSHTLGSTTWTAFDPENPLPYLAGARWQIRHVSSGNLVVDTGVYPDVTDPPVFSEGELTPSTQYQIRLLHWDGHLKVPSHWSDWVSFTTPAIPPIRPDAPDVTVVFCDGAGTVEIVTSAFSHPEPEAVHTQTSYRISVGPSIQGLETSDPAELEAYRAEGLSAGEWEFSARHRDDSGRWSAYGEADVCIVREEPPLPQLNHYGSTRICVDTLLSWFMQDLPVGDWVFDGELSANNGATWQAVFTGRTQMWWTFRLAGRPDGVYLWRIRARHAGTSHAGDWTYMVVRVDRSCSETITYDLSAVTNIAEEHPEWEQIWRTDKVSFTPVDSHGRPGGGMGILGSCASREGSIFDAEEVTSALVFKELGQPTLYEAEVEFVLFGKECAFPMHRWSNLYSTKGGLVYAADGMQGDLSKTGHSSLVRPGSGHWPGGTYGCCVRYDEGGNRIPGYGLCTEPCSCLSCIWCSFQIILWGQEKKFPTHTWEYSWPTDLASIEHRGTYPGIAFPFRSSGNRVPVSGTRSTGLKTSVRRGGSCDWGCGSNPWWDHTRYVMRKRVTRTITGGVLVQTKVLGPRLDSSGWQSEIEYSFADIQKMGCGWVGLCFSDVERSSGIWDDGVIFTSFSITPYEYDDCLPPPPPEPGPEPEYEPSKPCEVIVRCYDDDRETIRWEVGDNPQHPNPYLVALENYGEQELDIVNGAATVGQLEVIIIDRSQVLADQDSGWLTERYRLVHGRRGRALRYIDEDRGWVVLADGPNSAPRLDESYAAMRYVIRDTRETERKVEAFVRGGTTTVFPRGVRTGFGRLESGDYQIPATVPWPATATVGPGFVTFEPDGGASGGGVPTIDAELIVTPAMREATEPMIRFYEFSGMSIPQATVDNVEIWWRPAGGGEDDWKILRDSYWLPVEIFGTTQSMLVVQDAKVQLPSGSFEDVDGLAYVRYYDIIEQSIDDWPAHEQAVEIMLVYVGPPSRSNPMHIEGITTGELLQNGYDGLYSEPDPLTGEHVPTGIRYHEEDLLQMQDPVRLRLTAPVDDFRAWTERAIYAPTGWVPALDNDGRISPKSQVPPLTFDEELLIDNAVTEPQPEWSAGERVVNVLRFRYPRHYQADPEKTDTNDRIETRDIMHEWRDEMMIDRHDIQLAEYDGQAFAAVGDEWGQALMDPQQERGYGHAENRKLYIFDRYKDGTPIIEVPVMREHCALLRAGDWVRVDLSWFPDHDSGRRGMLCGGQVLAIHDVDCAWRILLIERVVPLIEVS